MLRVCRRVKPHEWRVDVCAVVPGSAAVEALLDAPALVPAAVQLATAVDSADTVEQLLSDVVRAGLVRAVIRAESSLPTCPDGALLEVGEELTVRRPDDLWPDERGVD